MENHSSFYLWLRQQNKRDGQVGDFARDAMWAPNAPKDTNHPEPWRAYCTHRNLPFLRQAFEEAWHEYAMQKLVDNDEEPV